MNLGFKLLLLCPVFLSLSGPIIADTNRVTNVSPP